MPLLVDAGPAILPNRTVRFRLAREAHSVRLAADFTRWSNTPLVLQRNGPGSLWEATTPPLSDGVHFYKYIADGQWMHDPSHPMVEADGCGGFNSVFGLGGPSLGEPGHLRVASLNLNTYQEGEPLRKLEQVAYTLAAMDVDLVALQEVGEHVSDPGEPNAGEFLQMRLRELTGQPWEHSWRMAHLGFDFYREGVSLLAPLPLENPSEYRLSQGRLARNALAGSVTLKGITLRLVSTHITWATGGGLKEMQTLMDGLRAECLNAHHAVLLAGDLNASEDEPQLRAAIDEGYMDVSRAACEHRPFLTAMAQPWQGSSWTSDPFRATSRIDYQLLRTLPGSAGLRVVGCVPIFNGLVAGDVYQPRVSDHIGILGIYAI